MLVYQRVPILHKFQDVLGLVSSRVLALLSKDLARKTTMTVIHRYHKDMMSLPPTKIVNLGMFTTVYYCFTNINVGDLMP